MKDIVQDLISSFFEKLDINIDSLEVSSTEETNIFNIKIKTEESWLIIWPHWKTLDAFQNILKLMCSKKTWEKIKLHLEVNDYIKSKDDRLLDFIKHKIDYLVKTWKDIKLPFYTAYERKKIHSFVAEMNNKWIYTKSIWEWKDRRLHLCKEDVKLTIDIDWDDI